MKRVAVIPGDGIGPEVIREAVRVLEHLRETSGRIVSTETHGCVADELFPAVAQQANEIIVDVEKDPFAKRADADGSGACMKHLAESIFRQA